MALSLHECDGYLPVEFTPVDESGAPLPPVTVMLDVYAANNAFAAICLEHEGAEPRGDAWAAWLGGKGLRLSTASACRVIEAVADEVERIKKKFAPTGPSPTPDSPASTGSR